MNTTPWPGREGDLDIAEGAFDRVLEGMATIEKPRDRGMTEKVIKVLQLAADGLTTQETATVLGKKLATIQTQRQAALRALDARNIPAAIAVAMREGLIE